MYRSRWHRAGAQGTGTALAAPMPPAQPANPCGPGYYACGSPSAPGEQPPCCKIGPGLPFPPKPLIWRPTRPNPPAGAPLGLAGLPGAGCDNLCAKGCMEKCRDMFCSWDPEFDELVCHDDEFKNSVLCTAACVTAQPPTQPGAGGSPTRLRAANAGGAAAQYGRSIGLASGQPRCDADCADNCTEWCVGVFCPGAEDGDLTDGPHCKLADAFKCASACIKAQEPTQPGTRPGGPGGLSAGRRRRRRRGSVLSGLFSGRVRR